MTVDGEYMIAAGHKIKVTAIKNPAELPHKELDVDIALECTGIFTSKDKAGAHLDAGAKRVLVSAPGRRRRPDRGLWRQPRQADQGPSGRLQRVLHHQLPGAGGQGAERRGRHRARHDDHHPFLHQRPAVAGPDAQGSLSRPRRGAVDDPDLDRRRQGGGPGAAGTERQAGRRVGARADAELSRWWI